MKSPLVQTPRYPPAVESAEGPRDCTGQISPIPLPVVHDGRFSPVHDVRSRRALRRCA